MDLSKNYDKNMKVKVQSILVYQRGSGIRGRNFREKLTNLMSSVVEQTLQVEQGLLLALACLYSYFAISNVSFSCLAIQGSVYFYFNMSQNMSYWAITDIELCLVQEDPDKKTFRSDIAHSIRYRTADGSWHQRPLLNVCAPR